MIDVVPPAGMTPVPAPTKGAPVDTMAACPATRVPALSEVIARVEMEALRRPHYQTGPLQMVRVTAMEWAVIKANLPA